MNISALLLAYTAAVLVALAVTSYFSSSIEEMLSNLLPEETAPHWARFIRFGLFVAACIGGLPGAPAAFVDRAAPPPPPPGMAEGLMLIMNSASGALMASAWILLLFFGAALAVQTAGRAYAERRKYREQEARQDRSEPHGEPVKRMRPAEPRPISQEKPAPQPPQRR